MSSLQGEEIAFILLLVAVATLLIWIFILNRKINNLLAGGIGENLPETMNKLGLRVGDLEKFENNTIDFLKDINRRLRKSPQGVGLVRFNAFKDGGNGGQSFALSLIDEEGNGIVVSSIYGRGHVGVYSKPIIKFESQFELTDEEKDAIKESKIKLGLKA